MRWEEQVNRKRGRELGLGISVGIPGVRHSNTRALTGHNSRAAAKRSVSNEACARQQIFACLELNKV